jgi:hypothetical protein
MVSNLFAAACAPFAAEHHDAARLFRNILSRERVAQRFFLNISDGAYVSVKPSDQFCRLIDAHHFNRSDDLQFCVDCSVCGFVDLDGAKRQLAIDENPAVIDRRVKFPNGLLGRAKETDAGIERPLGRRVLFTIAVEPFQPRRVLMPLDACRPALARLARPRERHHVELAGIVLLLFEAESLGHLLQRGGQRQGQRRSL